MALALAIKRTTRFYAPPVRRWVDQNVLYVVFFLIGLTFGHPVGSANHERISNAVFASVLVLIVLKKWAGNPTVADQQR
jgi:hypothetical protein